MRPARFAMALAMVLPTAAFSNGETTLQQTQAFFAAMENESLEQIEALLDDDVVNTLPFAASGATTEDAFRIFTGRAEVMGYFAGALGRIPEVAFTDPEITVSADGTTAFVETRGAMVLADGRDYANLYVWRIDFTEGRISAITEYLNPVTAALAFNVPLGPQPSQ